MKWGNNRQDWPSRQTALAHHLRWGSRSLFARMRFVVSLVPKYEGPRAPGGLTTFRFDPRLFGFNAACI